MSIDYFSGEIYFWGIKKNKKTDLYEIVTSFSDTGEPPAEDGFYDDCPICQQLRRDLGAEIIVPIPFETQSEEDE